MPPLRVIIVDDENLARRGLKLRLDLYDNVDVVAECANGQEALTAIASTSPDLVFLDIEMPGMSGFDVIARLQSDTLPMIVFVTAYDEYAVQAFRVHAVDYMLKPIEDDRLAAALERAAQHREQTESLRVKQQLLTLVQSLQHASATPPALEVPGGSESGGGTAYPERLPVRDGSSVHFIPARSIDWVDAAGDYMCIHAGGETHIMRATMKQLEAMLDPERFLRIHRSTLVNISAITGAELLENGDYLLTVAQGSPLKVSRNCKDRVRSVLSL
ncbi:MAG: LytTR family DNA-binding domain-containing protein [Chromatocurvus sp.]